MPLDLEPQDLGLVPSLANVDQWAVFAFKGQSPLGRLPFWGSCLATWTRWRPPFRPLVVAAKTEPYSRTRKISIDTKTLALFCYTLAGIIIVEKEPH